MSTNDICLEPLDAFRDEQLYPRACSEVLATKRLFGVSEARKHAFAIANAMTDMKLEGLLR